MACKLLLIRHGETVDNVNRIMQGQTPGKLTENGINQARSLGAELSQKHIDAFVSSDLQRAVDTCVEVAAPTSKATASLPSPISSRLRC